MNHEYTVSTGYKIFYWALAALMFGLAGYLFTVPQKQGSIVFIFPLLIGIAGVMIIVSVLKGRIIVTSNSIIRISFLKTKEILFTDIKGFRVEDKIIRFQTVSPQMPKFYITRYSDFGKIDEFIKWLNNTFSNLDAIEYQEGLSQILSDNNLGITEDERKEKLHKAKYISLVYNLGGIALFIAGLCFHEKANGPVVSLITLLYPVLSVPIMFYSKGLIRFYSKKASPFYHIFIGTYISTIFFLVITATRYDILHYNSIWLFIIPAFIFGMALKHANAGKNVVEEKGSIILLLLISLLYGYGFLIQVDCLFDRSTEQIYHATVIDHYINHNKGTHPYIKIDQWGPQTQTKEIQVSMSFYDQSPIGSAVTIHLKKGLLNIPWYFISE